MFGGEKQPATKRPRRGHRYLPCSTAVPLVGGIRTHNRLIRRSRIPPIIVAGMLGHSLAILMTTYAHYIPGTQDEAARVMDDILTPITIDLKSLKPKS